MNWHRNPGLLDRLAAEHALGTLHGGARRRFEAVMRERPEVARAAWRWAERLAGMEHATAPARADAALWARIEGRAFGGVMTGPRAAAPATGSAAAGHGRAEGAQGRSPGRAGAAGGAAGLTGAPARAWAVGTLVLGLLLGAGGMWVARGPGGAAAQGPGGPQLPPSYVGVLATADGRPGLIVSSLRQGRTVDLKVVSPVPLGAGQRLVLWTLDGAGRAQAVAVLPPLASGFASLPLGQPAETVFARAVALGVSVEAQGPTLPAAPGGAYVYQGLCGKLWPVGVKP